MVRSRSSSSVRPRPSAPQCAGLRPRTRRAQPSPSEYSPIRGGSIGDIASRTDITLLLDEAGRGDSDASRKLMEIVYAELRALAGSYARGQRLGHTLQPTALVHEAFVKLVDPPPGGWNDRAHFFAVAATAMRQVLADHARARKAQKRGGDWERVTLDGTALGEERSELDLVALDEALDELRESSPRKHRVVELRFFGGLTAEETARALDLSLTTVESDWRAARAWLQARLAN